MIYKHFIKYFLGITALVFALGLNFKHAKNNYGILDSRLSIHVLALSSNTDCGEKIYFCRSVNCKATWKGHVKSDGCIPWFHNQQLCGFTANVYIEFDYFGTKENCTGGNEWEDCNACQVDCVP